MKQYHEMTLLEYTRATLKPSIACQVTDVSQCRSFRGQHKVELKAVLYRGDSVPPEVLKDYPELKGN
jgi:hypothetical protein